MDYSEAKRRFEHQKSNRSNVEAVWDVIQKYVLPFRALFYNESREESSIDWRRREIYDDTAVDAAQSLAATINSNLTSPVLRWFDITVKNKSVAALQEVKVWLESVSELIFQVFLQSNFNLAVGETYLDLVGFGTASFLEEVVENPTGDLDKILFKTIPIDEGYFDVDSEDRPINYYRILRWTPLQILDKFGVEGTPKEIQEMVNHPQKSSERIPVLWVVYRRHNVPKELSGRPVAPTNRPFGAKYFAMSKVKKGEEQLGVEGGYYEMPVSLPRWRKTAGSQWGYSPSMVVLSTILSLNQLIELVFAANEKFVDPPIFSTRRGIINQYDQRAGRVTYVQDLNAIKQWEYKGRLDFAFMEREALISMIRSAFFVDQLQLKESPAMTATEVNVRYQLMQKLLGPSVGQIQYDLLGPVIRRTFQILYRYNKIPTPPRALTESGTALEIEYLGPMAKAQRHDTMMAIERWMMAVGQMAQVFPGATDIPDIDETVKELGYSAGVPAKIINNRSAVIVARMKKQQQEEQIKQLAMAEQAGKAATAMQGVDSGRVREAA